MNVREKGIYAPKFYGNGMPSAKGACLWLVIKVFKKEC